jgi:hypothetical protein
VLFLLIDATAQAQTDEAQRTGTCLTVLVVDFGAVLITLFRVHTGFLADFSHLILYMFNR